MKDLVASLSTASSDELDEVASALNPLVVRMCQSDCSKSWVKGCQQAVDAFYKGLQKTVEPSVFNIQATFIVDVTDPAQDKVNCGTAFAVAHDGEVFLVTCNHVMTEEALPLRKAFMTWGTEQLGVVRVGSVPEKVGATGHLQGSSTGILDSGTCPLLPQDLCLLKTEHVVHNLPTLQLCPDLLEVSPTSV